MGAKNIFVALLSCFILSAAGQQNKINLLDAASEGLFKKIRAAETERIYLTTDRSIYQAGERVWFRSFLLRSFTQSISVNTRTVFVDLVDEKDSVLTLVLLNAGRGQYQGKIDLPPSMHPGFYWLRAYTKSIAERESSKVFMQPLYVVNNNSAKEFFRERTKPGKDSLSMQFFPEGGALMTGANSTIAFRILDGNGHPVSLSGYLKDQRDSVVTQFSSDKYGLGKFAFTPRRYSKYMAELTSQGRKYIYKLPPFDFYAAQISVINQNNGDRKLRVLLEDSIYRDDFRTYLVGIAGTKIYFASIGTGMYEASIPEAKFPHGPVTFYLLDTSLTVLSERTIYCKGNNPSVQAGLDKPVYHKRDKGELTVSVTGADARPISSSFSVAVGDSGLIRAQISDDLLAGYSANGEPLLSNWYLAAAEDLTDDQLDELMLQRKNLRAATSAGTLQDMDRSVEDSLLYIKGLVANAAGQPMPGKIVTLFLRPGNMPVAFDTTGSGGRFWFPIDEYPDSTNFSIQVSNLQGVFEEAKILVDRAVFPQIEALSLLKPKLRITPPLINNFLRSHPDTSFAGGKKTLKPVTVTAYKKKEANYDESKRISQSSKIITSDKFSQGVGGVRNAVLGAGGFHLAQGFLLTGGIPSFSIGPGSEPIVLVDGVQINLPGGTIGNTSPVLSYLEQLSPSDIDFIEILQGPQGAAYGVRGGNGVILINSKNPNENNASTTTPNSFWARGYQNPSFFASPDYDNSKIRAEKSPDFRSTISWNGNAKTDSSGTVKFSFFTPDVQGSYKIVIRGITVGGDLFYKTVGFRNE